MPGERVYMVVWYDDRPRIAIGRVVRGPKRSRVRWDRYAGSSRGFPSMKDAIADALRLVALVYGVATPFAANPREPQPWKLADAVTKLWRLYRTLRKHHLVPESPGG